MLGKGQVLWLEVVPNIVLTKVGGFRLLGRTVWLLGRDLDMVLPGWKV